MSKLYDCIIKKNTSYIPIWFMRQAGRYLPEFRKIRRENQNFIKLCLNVELTKNITLQPLSRFDLDAAIIFSDILMIPYGLGQKVEFKKGYGPQLGKLEFDNLVKVNANNFASNLIPVYDAIRKVKDNIGNKSLIGFVGAPWTLLLYMLNLQSPKKNFNFEKIKKDENLLNKLINKLVETICVHIKNQVEAGADIIQIFDSWAGLLPERQLEKLCYEPTAQIVNYVKSLNIPVICFPRGINKNYSKYCSIVQPDCISIDYEVDPKWIKSKIKNQVIQGGMDPKVLLKNKEDIKKEVKRYLDIFSDVPYIFNLGHGVLPETKPENIEFVIKLIKDSK